MTTNQPADALALRLARPEDMPGILAIYARYIDTTITFEYGLPTLEVFARRMAAITATYPVLVAEWDSRLVGYAYAHPYREREAYQWGAELSVYLHPDDTDRGAGSALYRGLMALLKAQNVCVVYGAVTGGNEISVRFHEKLGFRLFATFCNTGYKNGQWLDVLWYERQIAEFMATPAPLVPIGKLDKPLIRRLLDEAVGRAN